jgi:hypothetical protein
MKITRAMWLRSFRLQPSTSLAKLPAGIDEVKILVLIQSEGGSKIFSVN